MHEYNHSIHHMDKPGPHAGHPMMGAHTPSPSMHQMRASTNHSMMGMTMYFHTDLGIHVLFHNIYINTVSAMVGACIVTFLMGILYESLKVFREHLLRKAVRIKTYAAVNHTATESLSHDAICVDQCARIELLSRAHFIQTLLHILQIFLSYLLMLIFMTFSVWLCLAVVLGAGVGYFMFGWKRSITVDMDINDHCH